MARASSHTVTRRRARTSCRSATSPRRRARHLHALGYLARKAHADGDLALAVELSLESAALAHEIGFAWWKAGQLLSAAAFERKRGHLDAGEAYALRALRLSLDLGDRMRTVFAGSVLAMIASGRDDAEQAGRLWGAVENEASSGHVGRWEQERAEIEALVLSVDSHTFAQARAAGSLLSIAEAAGIEAAQTEP